MPVTTAALLFGSAATVGGAAATAGLIGTAGAFALPTALTTAGIGLGVAGTLQAGREAEAAGRSQRAWDEYNAQLAERQAVEEQEAAAVEERKLRKGGARLKARQRVGFAKAGVTFEGSPMAVLEETASEIELDALQIRRGGQVGAQQQRAAAVLSRLKGKSAILRGKAKRRASITQALGLGLIGAGTLGLPGGSGITTRGASPGRLTGSVSRHFGPSAFGP